MFVHSVRGIYVDSGFTRRIETHVQNTNWMLDFFKLKFMKQKVVTHSRKTLYSVIWIFFYVFYLYMKYSILIIYLMCQTCQRCSVSPFHSSMGEVMLYLWSLIITLGTCWPNKYQHYMSLAGGGEGGGIKDQRQLFGFRWPLANQMNWNVAGSLFL